MKDPTLSFDACSVQFRGNHGDGLAIPDAFQWLTLGYTKNYFETNALAAWPRNEPRSTQMLRPRTLSPREKVDFNLH